MAVLEKPQPIGHTNHLNYERPFDNPSAATGSGLFGAYFFRESSNKKLRGFYEKPCKSRTHKALPILDGFSKIDLDL